jgi:hypothetical protein
MELVNLMLTGAAVSNVFDAGAAADIADASVVDDGGGAGALREAGEAVLGGVCRKARVGLLTLFEWYR